MNRTRIVRWLRVILPLAALAILSTLFLLSRKPGSEPALPYTETEPGEVASGQRITAPEYAGVTGDGASISLSAVRANPAGDGANTDAEALRLTWRAQSGLAADLSAPEAAIGDGRVTLSGGVRMTTSSGWVLTAPEFRTDTGQSLIEAPSQVRGKAPFGELSAGAMALQREDGADDHVLNFTDGVRLLYQP